MNRLSCSLLCSLFVVLLSSSLAYAVPAQVIHIDSANCDTLFVPTQVHELGIAPTFSTVPDELISALDTLTLQVACPASDDPLEVNTLVQITNLTPTAWADVWYVADPVAPVGVAATTISNFDGFVDDVGFVALARAFLIDSVGVNKPLVFESGLNNDIFEPGETWHFIIDDYFNTGGLAASLFDSIGVASLSTGGPPSSGSIIARAVPEPSSLILTALGLLGLAVLSCRKRNRTC